MKTKGLDIRVLVSPVHDCLNPVTIEPGGKRIAPRSLRWIMNPYDAFALEEALRLKERSPGSRVRVTSLSAPSSEKVLRECVSVGADEVIQVLDEGLDGLDPYGTAFVLAAALRREPFDLLLCGWRRSDLEHGQVGPVVAELLGLPLISAARKVLPGEDGNKIFVDKRVPGYLLKLSCTLPAMVTLEKGQILRYPRYPDRRRAQKVSIPTFRLKAIGLEGEGIVPSGVFTKVERFTPPKPVKRSSMASDSSRMSAAARLQRIMSGGVQDKKEHKIWECKEKQSVVKAVEYILREKMVVL